MPRGLALLLVVLAGAGLAVQPVVNAQLARSTGALQAAFVSLALSTCVVGGALVATGGLGGLAAVTHVPVGYLLGGLVGALNVTAALVAVPVLGAGGAVAATVGTQLAGSVVLDRLGVLGLEEVGLSPLRLAGVALLAGGVVLVTRSG